MKKNRAILLLITLVVAIGGYVAWAAWDPTPTLQSMTFHANVNADARRAAEEDFRSHPPKARKLTWQRLLDRLANPYQPREKPSIGVGIVPHTDGGKLLFIGYPRGAVYLAPTLKDRSRWGRAFDQTVN